jgi:hypothetical protein
MKKDREQLIRVNNLFKSARVRCKGIMLTILFIVALIVAGLAMPSGIRETSWERFVAAAGLVIAGLLVPVAVFLLSTFLVPEWKGACQHGWIDCFFGGKLALSPLVLWACCSFYSVEILRIERPVPVRIIMGLWTGAVIAAVSLVYVVMLGGAAGGMGFWLLVPAGYTALWYGARAFDLARETKVSSKAIIGTLFGSIPFWIGSVVWSESWYESLSNQPPSCFVVTAAGRGHRGVVGPFIQITRDGRTRSANQQLLTLWLFEAFWQKHSFQTHRIFRRIYNRIGPVFARRINSRWLADMTYLALKPVEFLAALVLKLSVCIQKKTYETN